MPLRTFLKRVCACWRSLDMVGWGAPEPIRSGTSRKTSMVQAMMDEPRISTGFSREKCQNGQKYVHIIEYVSWYGQQGKRNLSAVLLADGNYTVRVPAEKVEEYNG